MLNKFVSSIKRLTPPVPDLADLMILAGLSSLGRGLWLISPIYCYIGIGSILFLLGVVIAFRASGRGGEG